MSPNCVDRACHIQVKQICPLAVPCTVYQNVFRSRRPNRSAGGSTPAHERRGPAIATLPRGRISEWWVPGSERQAYGALPECRILFQRCGRVLRSAPLAAFMGVLPLRTSRGSVILEEIGRGQRRPVMRIARRANALLNLHLAAVCILAPGSFGNHWARVRLRLGNGARQMLGNDCDAIVCLR